MVLGEALSKVLNTEALFNTHGLIPETLWQQMGLPRFSNTQDAFSKSSVRYSFKTRPLVENPRSYVGSDIIAVKVARRNPPIYLFLRPILPLLNEPDWAAGRSLGKHSGDPLILQAEQTWLALFQSLTTSQIKHLPHINISLIWSRFQTPFLHTLPSSQTVSLLPFIALNDWFFLSTACPSANQPDVLQDCDISPMNWSDAVH